jgi:hypothetical protein
MAPQNDNGNVGSEVSQAAAIEAADGEALIFPTDSMMGKLERRFLMMPSGGSLGPPHMQKQKSRAAQNQKSSDHRNRGSNPGFRGAHAGSELNAKFRLPFQFEVARGTGEESWEKALLVWFLPGSGHVENLCTS